VDERSGPGGRRLVASGARREADGPKPASRSAWVQGGQPWPPEAIRVVGREAYPPEASFVVRWCARVALDDALARVVTA
jgi:hypothetical protein